MLKILHTADVHLGAKLSWLGNKAVIQQKQLLSTFSEIIDLAIEKKIDILLISGDLFDISYPNGTLVSAVQGQIRRLSDERIYTIIIPGNHDRLEPESIWTKRFTDSDYCFVINSKGAKVINLKELGVKIFGQGTYDQFSDESPLKPLIEKKKSTENNNYSIAMVHGSVGIHAQISKNYPISKDEIEESEFDYIALGDWHGNLDVSQGDTKAWYPGSPEIIAKDQKKSGFVIYVEIGEEVKVESLRVGQKKIREKEINLNKISHNEESTKKYIEKKIMQELSEEADEDTIALVKIIGKKKIDWQIDADDLEYLLKDKYFYLKVEDETQLEVEDKELSKYPEEMVIGRYIRDVRSAIQKEDNTAKKELLKDILQEGVNRLITK
ncbi:hypothetical protein GF362_04450 [Candidatus Dojkabacteria bacterium]|nr:hypothetical protein [Candidatus Dojkabacteria bacterium]